MSRIVIFDPASSIVINRVINYIQSGHTPDYSNNPNALINPDVSLLVGINYMYWKVNNGLVVEMTTEEKTAIDNSQNTSNGIVGIPMLLVFSKNTTNIFNEYINIDSIVSNKTCYNMIRNGTITGLSWNSSAQAKQNGSIIIQKNDVNLVSKTVTTDEQKNIFNNESYDFNFNDELSCYVSGCKIDNVIVLMEIVWRV
jgi:hypothetical protein